MLKVLDHPLVKRDLTILRDKKTGPGNFREAAERISLHLAIGSTKKIKLKKTTVKTPLQETQGYITEEDIILLPVLRAGLGLVNSFLNIYPDSKVGFIGLKRNEETFITDQYYYSLPEINGSSRVIILETMLATGGTVCATLKKLRADNVINISVAAIIAAPQGVEKVQSQFPDIDIVVGVLDEGLNEKAYIIPGLGDAGDRLYGTY